MSPARTRLLEPASREEFIVALADNARATAGGSGASPAGSGGSDTRSAGSQAGAIARGMGRCYGDAAQLAEGLTLSTARLREWSLDPDAGVLEAGAGMTLGEILPAAIAAGWIFPVLPGTQHVSIGGAIAGDVHGKNHLVQGTFARHVLSLELLDSAGTVHRLTPADPLFHATAGGMGLTGVILSARVALAPVRGSRLSVDTDRVSELDEACAALLARGGQHRIAWLDVLGRGVRGVVTRAEHLPSAEAPSGERPRPLMAPRARIPRWWPAGLLRPETQRMFNELRFRRAPRRERGRAQSLGANLFPLDSLVGWPRLYGPQGLVQYQFAVARGQERVMQRVIERLRVARIPVHLATLKILGDASRAPLSFPIEGWTLALDVPRASDGLLGVLDECDQLVGEAAGRLYLSKDVRMRPGVLEAMYPRLADWRAAQHAVDPRGVWRSDLALRTGLVAR